MPQQRDFITELEDAKRISSVEMQAIVNRLPANDLLSVADVAAAFAVSDVTIRSMIESGALKVMNIQSGRGKTAKPYYRVVRISVLNYIKKHLI